MRIHYPVEELPATPEYILALLVDDHRFRSSVDPEVDREAKLTFDTTVAEWRAACDFVGWRRLGPALNALFGTGISLEQWHAVLEPAQSRTLRGICELLSTHVKMWQVKPMCLMGHGCLAAGVFRTVRSLLADAGIAADNIRPSTPLGPFLRRWPEVFMCRIARIAPGTVPAIKLHTPLYNRAVMTFILGLLLAVVFGAFGWSEMVVVAVLLAGGGYAAIWFAARCVPPSKAEMGALQTFADLSRVIATQSKHGKGFDQ